MQFSSAIMIIRPVFTIIQPLAISLQSGHILVNGVQVTFYLILEIKYLGLATRFQKSVEKYFAINYLASEEI